MKMGSYLCTSTRCNQPPLVKPTGLVALASQRKSNAKKEACWCKSKYEVAKCCNEAHFKEANTRTAKRNSITNNSIAKCFFHRQLINNNNKKTRLCSIRFSFEKLLIRPFCSSVDDFETRSCVHRVSCLMHVQSYSTKSDCKLT